MSIVQNWLMNPAQAGSTTTTAPDQSKSWNLMKDCSVRHRHSDTVTDSHTHTPTTVICSATECVWNWKTGHVTMINDSLSKCHEFSGREGIID